MMTSRDGSIRALVSATTLVLSLAACQDEKRDFREMPPAGSPIGAVRESELQPGPAVVAESTKSPYGSNAYALSEGKRERVTLQQLLSKVTIGNVSLQGPSGAVAATVSASTNVLTVMPTSQLSPAASYTLAVSTAVTGEPVGATFLALVFLNEVPPMLTLSGAVLVLAGTYLVLREERA